MNLQIYQAYYQQDQVTKLDPAFIPYNNIGNDSQLLEYEIWHDLFIKHKDTDDYWGVLSWRWQEKIKLPGEYLKKWITSDSKHDVYFVNPYMQLLEFPNLWIQGEPHHPGLISFCDRLLHKLGYNFSITELEYTAEEYSTCHYFIGNAKFWASYLKWLDDIINLVKSDEQLNKYMFLDKSLYRGRHMINFPFVVERLFALFCIFNKDITVKSYPYYDSYVYNESHDLIKLYYDKTLREKDILNRRQTLIKSLK